MTSESSQFLDKVGEGRCSDLFAYSEGKIIKLFQSRFKHDLVVSLERTNHQVVSAGVPAPAVYGTEVHGDQTGIIMERIEGGNLAEYLVNNPGEAANAGRRLAQLHLDIHAQSIPGLPDKLETVRERVAQAPGVSDAIKTRCLDFLAGPQTPDVLVHGDLHPANVMLSAEGDYMAIDWDFATQGPAGLDVARAYFLLKSWALAPGEYDHAAVEAVREVVAEAYLYTYLEKSDMTMAEVESWMLSVSVARLCEPIPEEESIVRADIARLAG